MFVICVIKISLKTNGMFMFLINTNGDKNSWRCEMEFGKNERCKGRIYTSAKTGEFLEIIRPNTADANASQLVPLRQ